MSSRRDSADSSDYSAIYARPIYLDQPNYQNTTPSVATVSSYQSELAGVHRPHKQINPYSETYEYGPNNPPVREPVNRFSNSNAI